MARLRAKKRAREAPSGQPDFYEADEQEPDEERHAGQRYDVCSLSLVPRGALVSVSPATACKAVLHQALCLQAQPVEGQ
jgi:hypothetical protein